MDENTAELNQGADAVDTANRGWYIVYSAGGQEERVQSNLKQRVQLLRLEQKISNILVPTEQVYQVKEGKRRAVQQKIFPGYVLVEMVLDDETWHVVRSTQGVTGFVGAGGHPEALPTDEVAVMLSRMDKTKPTDDSAGSFRFRIGQAVRVLDGPFSGFEGTVTSINQPKQRAEITIDFFGRQNAVWFDVEHLEEVTPSH